MPSHSNATTFTRYLYLKTDVKQALIGAVLNKDLTSSMYWVFELFFSGFQEETMDTLWQIYYDFYATLNPLLEAYMKKKEASVKNDKDLGRQEASNPTQLMDSALLGNFSHD